MLAQRKYDRDLRLDLARGLAALLVVLGHLRAVLFVDLAEVSEGGVFAKPFYLLTSLGHQSVIVFFVLSGYLVGGSVIAAGDRFSFSSYGRARLVRLWTVLLPCLVMTLVVDQVVMHIAPDVLNGSYAGVWHLGPQPGQYDHSLLAFFGNVFFLQTLAVPVFGSNGPLWSLANEFWYYLLFPLIYTAVYAKGSSFGRGRRALQIGVSICIFLVMQTEMLVGFFVWLLGVLVASINEQRAPRYNKMGRVALIFVAIGAAGFSKWAVSVDLQMLGDAVLGIGVAFVLRYSPDISLAKYPKLKRYTLRLSDMSFSLYLSHFPFVMLIGTIFSLHTRMQPVLISFAGFALAAFGLLSAAYCVWYLFERRTDQVRRWLQ